MYRQVLCTLFCVAAFSACSPPASEQEGVPTLEESDFREEAERAAVRVASAGCETVPAPCPFGEQFSDLRDHPTLAIVSEAWIRSEDQLGDEVERAQLVLAVQQSSHTDVCTPSEALARVDQQEVRRLELHERTGGGAFTVFEYGVGDNSYGAVFARGALPVLASIHDGDLLDCTPSTGLGARAAAARVNPASDGKRSAREDRQSREREAFVCAVRRGK